MARLELPRLVGPTVSWPVQPKHARLGCAHKAASPGTHSLGAPSTIEGSPATLRGLGCEPSMVEVEGGAQPAGRQLAAGLRSAKLLLRV